MIEYTPESLLRYKEDHAPRFMFRWMQGWYDAWAADRQRIRDLEAERDHLEHQARIHAQEARTQTATVHEIYRLCTGGEGEPGSWNGAEPVRRIISELAILRGYKQGAELSANCARREFDQLREENWRLYELLATMDRYATHDPQYMGSPIQKEVQTELGIEPRWHTATGERPAEIDGYPLGDMDAVECGVLAYSVGTARSVDWTAINRYRRVYLDGVPCVVDDGTLLKEAEYVVTAYGVASATNVRPRLGHDGFWTTDCRGWLVGLGDNYTTPGDLALSLRRVWRGE